MRTPVREPARLIELLKLTGSGLQLPEKSLQEFPLKVPPGFIDRMQKNNPDDPLLRQVLPLALEDDDHPGFTRDPVGELARHPAPGLLQKYNGRALLITTGACAVHCRYCFRRHFPYGDENASTAHWKKALESLAQDSSINEIILSGGDPLVLADDKLFDLVHRLQVIPHLKRLRIHSRIPVVLPERITEELISGLSTSRLKPVLVIHCNHPNEINNQVTAVLTRIRRAGIVVLNQSVLLQGVNDHWEPLATLSERLFDYGVLPYYLHMLDPVAGAAHFHVSMESASAIMEGLHIHLPGYLVPRLVREQAGAPYKIPIL